MLGAVRHVEVAQEHVTCQEGVHEEADKYRDRRGGGQMVFQAEQTACTEDVRWVEHEAVERPGSWPVCLDCSRGKGGSQRCGKAPDHTRLRLHGFYPQLRILDFKRLWGRGW